MSLPACAVSDAPEGLAAHWAPPARRPRRRAAISLTPLIDVVFILLVFFMLASSFLDWRTVRVEAAEAGAGPASEGALLVGVSADGLSLGGRPVAEADLRDRLKSLLAEDPARRVTLRPAPGTPLQATVDALDLLAASGARRVGLSAPGGG